MTTGWFSSALSDHSMTETEVLTQSFWKNLNRGMATSPKKTTTSTTTTTAVTIPTPIVTPTKERSPPRNKNNISIDDTVTTDEDTLMSHSPCRPVKQVSKLDYSCVPVSKFLEGFRVQAAASLSNAYRTHHPLHKSASTGIITTSLAEDVFFLVEVQLNVMHDFLEDAGITTTEDGEAVVEDALLAIFRCIWAEQTRHRDTFLNTSFELCCATANDFFRMMTRMEDLMSHLELKYPFLEWNALDGDTKSEVVRREANDLATLFVSDAVYACQSSHLYIMRSLQQTSSVTDELFSRDWEDRYTHNEVILEMIRVFEDYNNDLQNYLCNDYLYHKVVVALVRASVCYYVHLLLRKSTHVAKRQQTQKGNTASSLARKLTTSEEQRRKELPFACPARALCRMMYDIRILQDYFFKTSRDSQALTRVVANETNSLTVIHEYLGLAVGHTNLDSLDEFIVVLHKRSGANAEVTRLFLSDLWLLAAPYEERDRIGITFGLLRAELDMVSARLLESQKEPEASPKNACNKRGKEITPKLDQMLQSYYEDRIWQEKISGCGGMFKGRGNR